MTLWVRVSLIVAFAIAVVAVIARGSWRDVVDALLLFVWPPREAFEQASSPRLARAWWIVCGVAGLALTVMWIFAQLDHDHRHDPTTRR